MSNELTPMMKQYMQTKEEYKDCILFYRLGDFYEMFFDDALTASKELEITLTGKNCGLEERAPMCGIPYHAVDSYLNRLVSKGYKVAICEQVEDPKTAKGIVKREVIRVVTPGTNLDTQGLDETKNNYIMCIVYMADRYGLSVADVTTGEYLVTELDSQTKLMDELYKFMPSEIVCNEAFYMSGLDLDDLKNRLHMAIYSLEAWYFDDALCRETLQEHFKVASLEGIGLSDYECGMIASGALLKYLEETQKNSLSHMSRLTRYATGNYMVLDSATRRNLELVETLREKQKRGSLLWVLDKTKTAMGARTLRKYVEQPLIDKESIVKRLDAVAELKDNAICREEIREYLNPVYDLERLVGKITYQSANPRDLIAFQSSLSMLPSVKCILKDMESDLLKEIYEELDPLEELCDLVGRAIQEEPPLAMKEGGIIKDGYNEEVDRLRKAKSEGKNWLADLETKEREKTGIKNLKIKFNKVFGYFFEVTKSYLNLVPDRYIRKQTLANCERYITEELNELESKILGAEEKVVDLEYKLFIEIRNKIAVNIERLQKASNIISILDVLTSFAIVAEDYNYQKPIIDDGGIIDIKGGRHPVIEKMLPAGEFIDNDTYLDEENEQMSIITGPNMAGKSTYMRQVALIVLMAQIGSFVPVTSARIGVVDKIFTRVGASDDLSMGQSTFMVEMMEVAEILREATKKSLVILDEIGRGTSTYDGLSIAWAVVEYIADKERCGAKTLFATHYHELTELEGKLEGVQNYCIAVKEDGEDIVFLRKIVKGGADRSYGIQVARLAGVPDEVLVRAREIADLLEAKDANSNLSKLTDLSEKDLKGGTEAMTQLSIFDTMETTNQTDAILFELRDINLSNVTPMDAMNLVYKWQNKLKEQW